MTLTELQQEVYTVTNRPDLVAETLLAVRQSTLALHQMDFFYKDLQETGISFTAPAYTQELEYRSLLPRFRALKYLRKSDSLGAVTGFFTVITPEQVVDSYGVDLVDVCYAAGASIEMKSREQFQYAVLGYYENPDISVASYSSWIAQDHPYAIVYEAAEKVFKMIGKSEEFAAFKFLRDEERLRITVSNTQLAGY